MLDTLWVLLLTTGSIGFFHTIMGPDHYIPFIVMSRSGRWSYKKIIVITLLCGIGHVLSSVVLAMIVILLGFTALSLDLIESVRGMLAGWILITFGLVYMIWGIKKSRTTKVHDHHHLHIDGNLHKHEHRHTKNHVHLHDELDQTKMTPWILFLIFVLGPCEPLIPLLMYPALNNDVAGFLMVTAIFTLITVSTMLGITIISFYGINLLPYKWIEQYTHALAGLAIFLCGFSIQFLGL
jgi:ABC-type nickel/cobalt efflux system permease component RcnA